MGHEKRFYIEPRLNLIEQKNDLLLKYPDSNAYIRCGVLIWKSRVKPTPFSKEYHLRIEYKVGKYPAAYVTDDDIPDEEVAEIPHNYGVDYSEKCIKLCLFKPRKYEWKKYYFISETIVPWAIEWLFFYETWKITGEWLGGGEHPSVHARRNSEKYEESPNFGA